MRRAAWSALAALGILGSGCGGGDGAPSAPELIPGDPVAQARAYLDSAITVLETKAYYRTRVDWPAVRAAARSLASGATTPAGTYVGITYAVAALGDRQSSFTPAGAPGVARQDDPPIGGTVGGRFGYLRVPTFADPTKSQVEMADNLQTLVGTIDQTRPCGWVVDLRHNLGGNMWPMLVGVGPLLGAVGVGAFVRTDGPAWGWWYENGQAGASPPGIRSTYVSMSRTPYSLQQQNPPVAVLTDSLTSHSGEAILVAFRGRPSTRSFGGATEGFPTSLTRYPLPDGASLVVMDALEADRTGKTYDDRIAPDEAIPQTGAPVMNDATVAAATNWLAAQPACAAAP